MNVETGWFLVSKCEATGRKTYMKMEESGELRVRETQVMTDEMIALNHFRQTTWDGWHGKTGAVVASVPLTEWYKWKRELGWKPGTKNQADMEEIKKRLNDSEFSMFRTGGGKLGKRLKHTPYLSPRVRKIIEAKP